MSFWDSVSRVRGWLHAHNYYTKLIWFSLIRATADGRHSILSTVNLNIGKGDWQACSSWIRHLEVASRPEEADRSTGVLLLPVLEKELSHMWIFLFIDEHNIMIYLPPSSHILLKFKVQEESTTVLIAADNWKVLPLINSYLLSLIPIK